MDSALFLRLATSRDKEGILALAREGITYEKPEDGYEVTYDHHQSSISGLKNHKSTNTGSVTNFKSTKDSIKRFILS